MKNTKRILALSLMVFIVIAIVACGNQGGTTDPSADGNNLPTSSITDPDEVRRIIAEVEENANWGVLAHEFGILDTITEIIQLDRDFHFRIGTVTGGRSNPVFVMEQFQAYVEASTAGRVRVDIFPLAQLGPHAQGLQGVLAGDITGWVSPIEMLAPFAPGVGVVSIPFFFEDGTYQAARIFRNDPTMDNYLKDSGFWPVSWNPMNSSVVLSNTRFETISDFRGARIWTQPTEMMQMTFSSFGAVPVVTDTSEIALGMQTGTLDAACSGITLFDNFGIQASAQYIHRFPMLPSPLGLWFGVEFMESLPEDLQEVILRAGRKTSDLQYIFNGDLMLATDDAVLAEVELVEPSDELLAAAREATAHISEFFRSQSEDNARLYETFKVLIENDIAAGGGGGLW